MSLTRKKKGADTIVKDPPLHVRPQGVFPTMIILHRFVCPSSHRLLLVEYALSVKIPLNLTICRCNRTWMFLKLYATIFILVRVARPCSSTHPMAIPNRFLTLRQGFPYLKNIRDDFVCTSRKKNAAIAYWSVVEAKRESLVRFRENITSEIANEEAARRSIDKVRLALCSIIASSRSAGFRPEKRANNYRLAHPPSVHDTNAINHS